jgi:hypothetical protein
MEVVCKIKLKTGAYAPGAKTPLLHFKKIKDLIIVK